MPRRSGQRNHSQKRTATTKAAPPLQKAPAVASVQQPSMLGQIASVAVGSAIGHSVGRMLTGGVGAMMGGETEKESEPQKVCQDDTKAFMNCMSENNNNLNFCQFYFDMLQQCQARFQ